MEQETNHNHCGADRDCHPGPADHEAYLQTCTRAYRKLAPPAWVRHEITVGTVKARAQYLKRRVSTGNCATTLGAAVFRGHTCRTSTTQPGCKPNKLLT